MEYGAEPECDKERGLLPTVVKCFSAEISNLLCCGNTAPHRMDAGKGLSLNRLSRLQDFVKQQAFASVTSIREPSGSVHMTL